MIAPMFGGAIAAFFYWFFIEAHHDKSTDSESTSKQDLQPSQKINGDPEKDSPI